ncbi:MAG: glycoside hydrolase family 99-like domain-containing protein [Victivallales bacterium]|nr:glycoside hydrolase family 99-like domain-containing protein [Victivallales bacterium]
MQIAAYYFPNYHLDPRNEEYHGPGWTEWELMKCARPRFPGHRQPRIPLWGYEDEADPQVMARKISAASDAGIDAFVFDWYWYDGPYLERALDEGFLKAANRDRLKFALMWANHDWSDRHPCNYGSAMKPKMLYPCAITSENVTQVWEYVVTRYMTQDGYWRVGGLPYFSIYAVNSFITRMGGIEKAARVLEQLRETACQAGLPGVHLNAVWYDNLDNQPFCVCPQRDWVEVLGFDSYTSYNSAGTSSRWATQFPTLDFGVEAKDYINLAKRALTTLAAPYFPVVTAGWDSTPRCVQSDVFRPGGYPWLPVMEPDAKAFGEELRTLASLLRERPEDERILFINAWNEWTEGSYLEPDTVQKDAYLRTIKEVTSQCR